MAKDYVRGVGGGGGELRLVAMLTFQEKKITHVIFNFVKLGHVGKIFALFQGHGTKLVERMKFRQL